MKNNRNIFAKEIFKSKEEVKRILSSYIYNKYFSNINILYMGKSIKGVNSVLHYAYVSFVKGSKYFKLINATIFSVHYFSVYPILLYVSDFIPSDMYKIFNNYDRLLVISIIPENRNVYFMKLRVILLAPVIVGQIVESDTIVLPGADCLFTKIEKEITDKYIFPMMPRHHDIRSPKKGNGTFNTLDIPMKNRTMRYMHAHISWTHFSLPYIAKIYMKSFYVKYSSDEYAMNVNLWESKAYKQWCTYDPLFSVVNLNEKNKQILKPFKSITFYNFIHGCKSQHTQNILLNRIKIIKERNNKLIYSVNKKVYFRDSCIINEDIKFITLSEKCLF